MRLQTATTTAPSCAYGLSSNSGFLFERQRTAMRQNAFARSRSATTKRKARESDDSDDNTSSSGDELLQPAKRVLLHGLKRMRVSSPPQSAPTATSFMPGTASVDSAMDDGDDNSDERQAAARRALIPVGQPRRISSARTFSTAYPVASASASAFASAMQMPPTDASCTALVPFHNATDSIPRAPRPTVELVESDDEACGPVWLDDDVDSDDNKPFVRFEEIFDDEPDAMEID